MRPRRVVPGRARELRRHVPGCRQIPRQLRAEDDLPLAGEGGAPRRLAAEDDVVDDVAAFVLPGGEEGRGVGTAAAGERNHRGFLGAHATEKRVIVGPENGQQKKNSSY